MKLTLFVVLLAVEFCSSYHLYGLMQGDNLLKRMNADLSDESEVSATLTFTADWKELEDGQLAVGESFKIVYDGSRLPDRPTMYGQPAWKIYAEYKFNDSSEYFYQGLDGPEMIDGKEILTTTIFVPYDAKKLVIWFRLWTYYGMPKYDSDHGQNYHFEITKPSIVFDKDWVETVHGDLEAGGEFDIYYDSKRLKENDEIFAQMKFSDEGEVWTEVLQGVGSDTTYQMAVVSVPDDAETVIMWFYHVVEDEKKYDSNESKTATRATTTTLSWQTRSWCIKLCVFRFSQILVTECNH